MPVRMKVEKFVVGNHDPQVLEGSTPDKGIDWSPGDEIVVTDELAVKFERSGMAVVVKESAPSQEQAVLSTPETAVRQRGRGRARA